PRHLHSFPTRRSSDLAAIRFLLGGLVNTLRAAALALVIAAAAGTLFALGRLSRRLPVRLAAGAYVQFFRSLPLLILIIFMYFGLDRKSTRLNSSHVKI